MSSKLSEKSHDLDHQLRTTPVAIIGMASIFPQARNLPEYWDNILNKINCITDVPADRWEAGDYYDPDPNKPDKSYCKVGGFIPDIDFDPGEFGLPPNILEVTDISQLLSLVVARDALADAGFNESKDFDHLNTGVILGAVGVGMKLYVPLMARLQYPVWERVLKASGVSDTDTQRIIEKIKLAYVGWEENSFPGSLSNVIAGRIANRFDLGGTNCVLDAACATSMAAIKMAIMELVEYRANMMITGGVDTDNSIGVYMSFSKTPAFSKGDAVRTFDAGNDGMMAGEGIGMLVLKRLADAERDGDRIYAVIRGVGSSSDGRFKSIYAPRPSGQAIALRRAYEEAGYSPSTVGLIEAHGTGTPAGDPAEFQGLREVFDVDTPQVGSIALGSVKSQIAHTKGAAGSAGMIKVALALYHKILPPTINVERPNPKLDIENSSFYINSETRPWFRRNASTPRRGGVSAFGFGGTNFHITLEEHQPEQTGAYRTNPVTQTVILSAPTNAGLQAVCQETLAKLAADADPEGLYYNQLVNQSETAEIPSGHARIGYVAGSAKEAQELLQTGLEILRQKPEDESWEHPKGIYYRKNGQDPKGKLVALFSGQGSQYLEMGRELACNFPTVRQVIGEMDSLFVQDNLKPLSGRIYPPPVFDAAHREKLVEDLTRTEHAQPAIGALSVALFKMLQQAGFAPDFVAGHSFGELTALWASGVLNDLDYFTLAKARGKAMSPPEDPNFDSGAMLAVKGDAHKVKEEIREFPEITLANWNSDNQIVLAGSKPSIASVQKCLSDKGYSVVLLPVSAAFHTPLVGHAQKPFARVIDSVTFNPPTIRLYSNTTGKAHSNDPEEIRKMLKGHILNPVLFKDEIENIYAEGGYFFIEFGPKNVLTNLVKNILGNRPHLAVALNASPKKDSDRQFREAVVQLRVAGLDLKNVDPFQLPRKTQPRRKKSLATVKLNGGAYVSPKTKAAFENALKDGFKVSGAAAPLKEIPSAQPIAPAPSPMPVPPPAPAATVETRLRAPAVTAQTDPSMAAAMERNLSGLREQQNEVTRLHQQYLHNEEEYTTTYARLSEQEIGLLKDASAEKLEQITPIFESLERSMARFHDHQAETLRVHAQYLKSQEEYAQNFVRLVQQQFELMKGGILTAPATPEAKVEAKPAVQPRPAAPVIEKVIPQPQNLEPTAPQPALWAAKPESAAPRPANGNGTKHAQPAEPPARIVQPAPQPQPPAAAGYDRETLTRALLTVVSEKTGYPAEMLELSSDMEADLGIDSIKRVEIMGALREQLPNLPKADPEAFAEVRTLGQTVDYMAQGQPTNDAAPAMPVVESRAVEIQPKAAEQLPEPAVSALGAYSLDVLTRALLTVVSEKTGYPAEMLELTSDMEADLGIDSIKRVEIMGALRELLPNLPKADPEAFAEVRTLGQTVDYMAQGQPQASQPIPASAVPVPAVEPAPSVPPPASPPAAATVNDPDVLAKALLAVVSEKTGYPVEMLELNSDMEADLGIDSIKRVEIMGALREQFPGLPQADPEAFAEARTLGNVVDYLTRSAGSPAAAPEAAVEETSLPFVTEIPRGVVTLKSLPEPDFADFNLPAGSVCLITDNGSQATANLAQELAARRWKVVVLSFPETLVASRPDLPHGIRRVTLADMSEEHLHAQLASIAQQDGPIAAVIHLNPLTPALPKGGIFSGDEKEIIKHIFLLAKHLKDPLTAAARTGGSAFLVVVSLDGEFGLGNQIDFDPISGGLFGLVKTLNLEWESVYCRAIDISPEVDPAETTRHILAELYDPNRRITEVGYSAQGRTTLVVEQAAGVME